jgi:hypothetical protein
MEGTASAQVKGPPFLGRSHSLPISRGLSDSGALGVSAPWPDQEEERGTWAPPTTTFLHQAREPWGGSTLPPYTLGLELGMEYWLQPPHGQFVEEHPVLLESKIPQRPGLLRLVQFHAQQCPVRLTLSLGEVASETISNSYFF